MRRAKEKRRREKRENGFAAFSEGDARCWQQVLRQLKTDDVNTETPVTLPLLTSPTHAPPQTPLQSRKRAHTHTHAAFAFPSVWLMLKVRVTRL